MTGSHSFKRIKIFLAVVIFAVCVFVLRKWKPSPTTVMIVAGVIGGIAYLII